MPAVIAVAHTPVKHVSDCLKTAVRMRGETCDVIFGPIRAELIKQQERIQIRQISSAD